MTEKEFLKRTEDGSMGLENLFRPIAPKVEGAMLTGYHALSTGRFKTYFPDHDYRKDETQMTMAELSARFWKRFNGPIKLLTDRAGYEFFKNSPLADVYDEILPILDTRCCGINHIKYWAAAKIQALSRIPLPCAIIDMDMVVLKPLDLSGERVVGACYEFISDATYPNWDYFELRPGYSFPPEWSEEALPINTAFLYINDEELRKNYTSESFRFMLNERETPDYWSTCMIFAEQRILGMCAESRGIYAKTLWDMDPSHQILSHFWASKGKIRDDKELNEFFMEHSKKMLKQLKES